MLTFILKIKTNITRYQVEESEELVIKSAMEQFNLVPKETRERLAFAIVLIRFRVEGQIYERAGLPEKGDLTLFLDKNTEVFTYGIFTESNPDIIASKLELVKETDL